MLIEAGHVTKSFSEVIQYNRLIFESMYEFSNKVCAEYAEGK